MIQKRVLPALIFSLVAFPAAAEIKRQHGKHVHGVGKLEIGMEGSKLEIELEAPSFDIVGFGHDAESAEDKKTAEKAIASFKAADKMFVLPSAAGCKLENVKVEHVKMKHHDDDDDHDHDKGHKKGDHDEGHDKGHKKDDHDHDHDKGHKEAGHHDDDDHDKGHKKVGHDDDHHKGHKEAGHHDDGDDDHHHKATHSEYHVHYNYTCSAMNKLDSIQTGYFNMFDRAKQLNAAWVNAKGQGQANLTKDSNKVQFK